MKITVTTLGAKSSKTIEAHAKKRAQKFTKYQTHIQKIQFELKHEKGRKSNSDENSAKIIVTTPQKTLVTKSRDADMYTAIDASSHKMEREIRKEKEKLVSKTRKRLKGVMSGLKWQR